MGCNLAHVADYMADDKIRMQVVMNQDLLQAAIADIAILNGKQDKGTLGAGCPTPAPHMAETIAEPVVNSASVMHEDRAPVQQNVQNNAIRSFLLIKMCFDCQLPAAMVASASVLQARQHPSAPSCTPYMSCRRGRGWCGQLRERVVWPAQGEGQLAPPEGGRCCCP
jgi:hypothetical protein